MDVAGTKKFSIDRDKSLALGGTSGSTVLPRFRDAIVGFTEPNRNVWQTGGEE
jgi:hypothetical protein